VSRVSLDLFKLISLLHYTVHCCNVSSTIQEMLSILVDIVAVTAYAQWPS